MPVIHTHIHGCVDQRTCSHCLHSRCCYRLVAVMSINVHDQSEMHDAIYHACIFAVREGFPHLRVRDIINPPHEWFDAALARQIVLHLMISQFSVAKRRVVAMQERSREAVNRALSTIDQRLAASETFTTHYRNIGELAQSLLRQRLDEDEAA